MSELPVGTVTFLFTDIEGSTRLAQTRPSDWPAILGRHRDLLRAAIASGGGEEVSTEGDSFFAVFASAIGAIAAAADAQRALAAEPWPDGVELRVRMGIHTGEAEIRDRTYVGVPVHRAARIEQAGHGGQVLLSAATRALVADSLPEGVGLIALGHHRLRDLEDGESLSQLVVDGLPAEFPPPRGAGPNTLPVQATSFFGRDDEIAEVAELLGGARLLTLTGPGGTGKTRLSLQAAAAVSDRFPDGVFFVPLGLITSVELVLPTIAHEVGLPDRGGSQPMARLQSHLRERTALLVLDNFEQISAAGSEIAELLAAAPGVRALVTSRSPLHVYGEREYPVPPLDVPDPAHLPPLATLSQYESVALFVDRARAALPSFDVTNENAPAVAEICYRLDGLPLAIELAAARIKLLSPQAILDRLGQRMSLLSGGSRDLPARQQTLRGAIEWSYDLLDDGDRRIFASFAAFVGGATFPAIEFVCADPDLDVFECLTSLVDKSLVRRRDGVDGEARFSMLDTIREYAVERLEESGRRDELRDRHVTWYLELAETAERSIMGADKRRWLDRLDEEHDNLRTAHRAVIEAGNSELATRLVGALWRFWQMRGHLAEGLDRANAAVELPGAEDHPECLVRALDAAGGLAYWKGDGERADAYYARELDLQRTLGNRAGEAWSLYSLAFTRTYWGNPAQTRAQPELLQEALDFMREAVAIYREIGDRSGMAQALWGIANVVWTKNPPTDSPEFLDARRDVFEALAIFEETGDSFMTGWCTYTISLTDLRLGDLETARDRLRRCLRIFHEAGDVTGYVLVLDGLAFQALEAGDAERAAILSGGVSVLERQTGTGLNPPNRVSLGFEPEALREDAATASAWEMGTRISTEALIAYALGEAD